MAAGDVVQGIKNSGVILAMTSMIRTADRMINALNGGTLSDKSVTFAIAGICEDIRHAGCDVDVYAATDTLVKTLIEVQRKFRSHDSNPTSGLIEEVRTFKKIVEMRRKVWSPDH